MTFLTLVFSGLALYGALTGHIGASMLALFMACLMILAQRIFMAQDKAWAADPRNARKLRPTQEVLDESGVECSSPSDQR